MNGEAFTAFSTIGAVKILTSNAFGQISRVSVRWLARSETFRTRLKGRREGDDVTGVQEFRKAIFPALRSWPYDPNFYHTILFEIHLVKNVGAAHPDRAHQVHDFGPFMKQLDQVFRPAS